VSTWVDTHCHLHMCEPAPDELLDRARAVGVGWIVDPGTDAASSRVAAGLAGRFPGKVLATAGLHPHEASRWRDEQAEIADLARTASAVGECGLDFYRNLSPREDQLTALREQLALADDLDKPVIVHCRDAFADVHELLESTGTGPRTVLHCWTGGPKWTKRFRDLDVTFSFAGPVAFATGDTVRRGAAEAPPDRTMVETDSPFLTPPPHRGEPNEPAHVVLVARALSEVWGIGLEEVRELTSATATRVFLDG
jgi:TatD DNase family protein